MSSPQEVAVAGLIDVHAHFLTDRYVAQARAAGHERPDGMPAWPAWSRDAHLRLMDAVGIDVSVLSISSPGVHFGDDKRAAELARHVNDEAAEVVASGGGRFRFFASLPLPDVAAALRELDRVRDAPGFTGVALLSHVSGRRPGDASFEPLWRALQEIGATAFLHPTSPPGWELVAAERPRPMLEFPFETARTVVDLLGSAVPQHYPRVDVIVPHAGGALPAVVDRVRLFHLADAAEAGPDLAVQLRNLWFDCAGAPLPAQLPALLRHVPPERILYGSDFCFTPAGGVALHLGALDAAPAPGGGSWRDLLVDNGSRMTSGEREVRQGDKRTSRRQRIARELFRRAAERVLLGSP